MKKKVNDHIQNQKKQPSLLQKQIDLIKEQYGQVFPSQDSQSNVDKSETLINSATSKKDKSGKNGLKPINTTSFLSQNDLVANKHEAQKNDHESVLDLIPMRRLMTVMHASLVNNEIELED